MLRHEIRLTGPKLRGPRLAGSILRDLLDLLLEGSRRALRLRIEGRSNGPGTPAWLRRAADFEFLGTSEGSTVLTLEAFPLREVLPGYLAEPQLDPSRSSLSLFEESFWTALVGQEDTDLLDPPMLKTLSDFSRIFAKDIEGIEFVREAGEAWSFPPRFRVQDADIRRVEHLSQKTRSSGRSLGQNDLWIAATAHAAGAHLLTMDTDFDELHPSFLTRTWIDPRRPLR